MTTEKLIVSKKRVVDFGEVYTPLGIVKDMVNLVDKEVRKIESKVLEPSCGKGIFLIEILKRKIQTILQSNLNNRGDFILKALSSLYGVDILKDNIEYTRNQLLETVSEYLDDTQLNHAKKILLANIIQGNTLEMKDDKGKDIIFYDWLIENGNISYIGTYFKDMLYEQPLCVCKKSKNKDKKM